ncbi:sugar ABC transporter substrate-binding protein [Oscillospiraceae bacterium PP1C4]
MKKFLALLSAMVLVCSAFAGCGVTTEKAQPDSPKKEEAASVAVASEPAADKGKQIKVGVALIYKSDEWLSVVADEFEKQAKDAGYEINIQDGNQDNEKQVQQIENFIAQKYDVIIVNAANVEGILPVMDKCAEAKIPVIAIDTPIDHPQVVTSISWDNYSTGVKLGEYAKAYIEKDLADKKEVNVVMINAPAFPHLVKRDEGFLSVLNTMEKVKVIATQDASGSRETSANIINNNIAKGIDVVYGVVDNHAWGAVTALEEANAEKCAVLSCGGFGNEPFTALQGNQKYYKALIVVPPKNIVKDSLSCVKKVLNGESVEKTTNIEFGLADASNVKDFL